MPIFIAVEKVVLLVCIKSALIMSFPAQTINKTPLNLFSLNPLALRSRISTFLCTTNSSLLKFLDPRFHLPPTGHSENKI